jgi:hypothetical protein
MELLILFSSIILIKIWISFFSMFSLIILVLFINNILNVSEYLEQIDKETLIINPIFILTMKCNNILKRIQLYFYYYNIELTKYPIINYLCHYYYIYNKYYLEYTFLSKRLLMQQIIKLIDYIFLYYINFYKNNNINKDSNNNMINKIENILDTCLKFKRSKKKKNININEIDDIIDDLIKSEKNLINSIDKNELINLYDSDEEL